VIIRKDAFFSLAQGGKKDWEPTPLPVKLDVLVELLLDVFLVL